MGVASSTQTERVKRKHAVTASASGSPSGSPSGIGITPSSSSHGYVSPFVSMLVGGAARCDAVVPPPPPPVLDASSSSSSSSSLKSFDPPPPPPSEGDSIADAAASSAAAPVTFPNPGPYEMALMDAKRLFQIDTHDGMRVDVNKQLSPYMAVVHSFWMGTSMLPDGRNSTYTFVTQVADEEGFWMARWDPSRGSVDGRMQRGLLGGIAMGKAQFNAGGDGGNDQLMGEIDVGGATWMCNLKYGSMAGGNMYGCNYYQAVTHRWSVGGEGMYLAANQALLSNYTVKYQVSGSEPRLPSGDHSVVDPASVTTPTAYSFGAQYLPTQQMMSLVYRRDVTPKRVTLGAQLEFSPVSLESQIVVGAEFKLTRSKYHVVLDFSSPGIPKIQSTLEAKLGMAPGSPTLNFSAEVDHAKEVLRFGYGLNIGG